jgi:hypothetical protein
MILNNYTCVGISKFIIRFTFRKCQKTVRDERRTEIEVVNQQRLRNLDLVDRRKLTFP